MTGSIDPVRQADCFHFAGHHFDADSGMATLCYRVDGINLEEKLLFPFSPWPVDASRQAAFFAALELLHLIAGVSYYKAGLARRIDTGVCRIDASTAGFLDELYLQGLGEFAYENHLDLAGLIRFESGATAGSGPGPGDGSGPGCQSLDLPERALVAMGGGKDSLVCLHLLGQIDIEVQPVCVGGSDLIGETVKTAGLPLIRIRRSLAPALADMNASGAWNGHVPVTAINSAILLCAALLYGYRYVVFANEASASEATLTDGHGREINHQYSKSFAFEKAFRDVIARRVSPDLEYFSLLRPFSETAVTRRFSKLTLFHRVFSSCNRNFHQDGARIEGRWCCDCPKCRFTALALAPFLGPAELVAIQGADLLDMESQLDGFRELCGIGSHKPFECVGSIEESRGLVRCLASREQWREKLAVARLADLPEIRESKGLETGPDYTLPNCIPPGILARLDEV